MLEVAIAGGRYCVLRLVAAVLKFGGGLGSWVHGEK